MLISPAVWINTEMVTLEIAEIKNVAGSHQLLRLPPPL